MDHKDEQMNSGFFFEQAAERMHRLAASEISSQLHDANEATTRLLLIDEVLSILGWSKTDYNPEKPTSTGGYTDYRLTIDGNPRLIVEAKRVGIFPPIATNLQRPDYKNSFLNRSCGPEVTALLHQCRSYCSDCGVPYAIATTGEVWIIMMGFKFGVEWGDLRSFVYHSLSDISSRFVEFYGLVSREAVSENSLEEKFGSLVVIKPSTAIRPRDHIDVPVSVGQVPERRFLEMFFDQFFGEITGRSQREMLQHCYVGNRKLTEYSRDLQRLLEYNAVLDDPDEAIEQIDENALEEEIDLQLASTKQRTVLLVGNVGAGKSTFVHRFIQSQKNPRKSISLVLDLINEAVSNIEHNRDEEHRLSARLLAQLESEFQTKVDPNSSEVLRGCFEVELGKFKKLHMHLFQQELHSYLLKEESLLYDLSKDKYAHLVGYLTYLRKRKYKVWIVFDNVDRGSDSYQEFIYAFAHRLANAANCVTLLTLREDTYLEAKRAGFLDVRNSDVAYQIVAPEFKQVISRRRKYVQKLINEERLPRHLKERLSLVELLNNHINQLVLGQDNRIRMLIATCSLSNVRYALRLLREYYTSFHSTFHTSYNKVRDGKELVDALSLDLLLEHQRFLQALMLGNTWSFDENGSEIVNLFSADLFEQSSHFLALRLLAYLALERSNTYPRSTVTVEKLTNSFVYLGYQRHHIENAVRKLLATNLLLSPSFPIEEGRLNVPKELPSELKLSLSAKGYYYLTILAGNPYYQMRAGEDTVWYDGTLAATYTKQLQESNKVQAAFKDDDALLGTTARDIFIQYLRKSLLAESGGGHLRLLSVEWARLVEDTIERHVFNEAITQLVYTSESQESTSFDIMMGMETAYAPSLIRHAQRQLSRKFQPRQLSLFGDAGADYGKALEEALDSLGDLPKGIKYNNKSRYVIRVLWALELASRAGLGPQRASELGIIIRTLGQEYVAGQNVAQFFREQHKSGEYTHLWKEEPHQHFTITSTGRDLLDNILANN